MNTTVNISDDNLETLNRYSDVVQGMYGYSTKKQIEEARSYATEFVSRLLNDNPDVFPHSQRMQELYAESHS